MSTEERPRRHPVRHCAMARETMVTDFLGVGRSEQVGSEDSERGSTLVRPIPSVPETMGTGSLSRGSPAPEGARAADRDSSINRLRQGSFSCRCCVCLSLCKSRLSVFLERH